MLKWLAWIIGNSQNYIGSDANWSMVLFICMSSQILFVFIDAGVDANGRILEYFGLKEDELPTIRLITLDGDMKKYKPDFDELTTDNIKSFVKSFQDGNLKVRTWIPVFNVFLNAETMDDVGCCQNMGILSIDMSIRLSMFQQMKI